MPQVGYSHRSLALGRRGMVAAAHPYAALAGLDVLKAGGTAADAAVATNAVLGVTEPQDCGVGGDFFCLYYEAATGRWARRTLPARSPRSPRTGPTPSTGGAWPRRSRADWRARGS